MYIIHINIKQIIINAPQWVLYRALNNYTYSRILYIGDILI